MYLHLGRSVIVPTSTVVGVFDLDTASSSRRTQLYLERAQKEGRLKTVVEDLPRSFVVCIENGVETVYLSQISSRTLAARTDVFALDDSE